jgi:hypothetical protein
MAAGRPPGRHHCVGVHLLTPLLHRGAWAARAGAAWPRGARQLEARPGRSRRRTIRAFFAPMRCQGPHIPRPVAWPTGLCGSGRGAAPANGCVRPRRGVRGDPGGRIHRAAMGLLCRSGRFAAGTVRGRRTAWTCQGVRVAITAAPTIITAARPTAALGVSPRTASNVSVDSKGVRKLSTPI